MNLQDGSTGIVAKVSSEGQLRTKAEAQTIQHHNSWYEQNTYQVISVDTGITAKTQTLLHLKNDSPDKRVVVSFVRMQAITTPTFPVATDYFEVGLGRTVASGGTVTTPVNMNSTSGKIATVTCTGIDPTMAGTFNLMDRQYIESDGKEYSFDKTGSLILGLNDTVEIRLVSSGTGEAKARISFMMIAADH